jgi:hypothetical protein
LGVQTILHVVTRADKKPPAASDIAVRIGAEFTVREILYHSAEQVEAIEPWRDRIASSCLAEVMQWSLTQLKTRCPTDTPPPTLYVGRF